MYTPEAQEEGLLPIPIGPDHKFPPIALAVSTSLVYMIVIH